GSWNDEETQHHERAGPDDDGVRHRAPDPRGPAVRDHPVRDRLQQLRDDHRRSARRCTEGRCVPTVRKSRRGLHQHGSLLRRGPRPDAVASLVLLVVGARFRRHGRRPVPVLDQPHRLGREEREPPHHSQGASGMSRTRNERGQVIVLTVIALATLLGMGALVLDVGAWFHEKRQLQATADAAALAGAQALPDTPGTAQTMAVSYADQNGGGVLGADVTISSTNSTNDTISVAAKKNQPGFFSRVFGVSAVDVGAKAKALVGS